MNKNWFGLLMVLMQPLGFQTTRADSSPMQRVDVINMLGVGVATVTDVTIALSSDEGASFCYSTTIPFRQNISVLVGAGQACTNPVNSITITPLPEPNIGLAYTPPGLPTYINSNFYLNQIVITQNTAPVFDPKNGGLMTLGTIKTVITNNITS